MRLCFITPGGVVNVVHLAYYTVYIYTYIYILYSMHPQPDPPAHFALSGAKKLSKLGVRVLWPSVAS